ncbi:30S ribosomal protein S21 [candidate division WOR-1 bacterium RIFOXYD2_FULL_36_8]|uniref:Small ribosomal subunit protein bS21 n=1 Tax=candidate division WOR-1 bacterium RIFOXYB2_FULL_36_35 TaxID=1802578 RepID=A0A1F4S7J8_UNCSA|nr:MAG: 30S ribosomal protein S21 [candidate division WOR-1 bacterium RIFOXYA2_FULL_36_21]OGC16036.1 MAG: 30S ribosomal protein S21 [candidate division WOR-1 bacterium RIFOXYA12_FULL_36_13]OGC16406.1 MAG: 30S ribosomal protein S21 [candidate division WOR-1 bacterium RIFOXYB2_FULL_36_35]OGC39628.1 MAG: 30S ribosomal protein S21 [candidate division WOR-1 bacterium RIFOXYD2_FULL_36_8]
MTKINVSENESIDKVLKKFKMKMRREGIIDEIKKREFYEKPSQRRRKEKEKAKRREQRRQHEED